MRTALAWIYGLQCFLVIPWFLGAFYREEMSTVPWREFARSVERYGTADALFGMYLYAIFYSVPLVLSLVYLPKCVARELRVLLSIWGGYSFFLFLPAILGVMHHGWLFGGWVVLSTLAAFRAAPLIKQVRKGAENDT